MSKEIISELNRMKDLFGYKKGQVISEQEFLSEAEIPYPEGISKQAVDKIMSVSAQNKKNLQGSYLAPLQQREIDKEFGQGTYQKFLSGGGQSVLDKKNTFKSATNSEQANNSDALAKQIYDELHKATERTLRRGIDEKGFEVAIKKINSKEVLDKLNNILRKSGGVGGLISNQFGNNNNKEKDLPFLRRMANHFYTLGIWVKNYDKPDGFKIPQLSPNSGTPAAASTTTPAAAASTTTPAATNKPNAPNFTPEPKTLDDQNNVLKKGMTGSKIKQLQQSIGLKGKSGQPLITGNFGGLTDAKLMELYPNEYSTDKGVNLTLFNKITSLKKQVTNVDKVEPAKPAQPIDPTTMQPTQPTNATQTVTAPAVTGVNQAAATTPGDYYKTLYNAGLIQGEGNNRVRYKGPELNGDQQNLLTQYMNSVGYKFIRKGNDKRLVYQKQ